jgi:hypothetical protein
LSKRRISSVIHDGFTISRKERKIYHEIFKETMLENRRCAELSLSDLGRRTRMPRTTVRHQLNKMVRRRLIELDKTHKTNTICINVIYREIYR